MTAALRCECPQNRPPRHPSWRHHRRQRHLPHRLRLRSRYLQLNRRPLAGDPPQDQSRWSPTRLAGKSGEVPPADLEDGRALRPGPRRGDRPDRIAGVRGLVLCEGKDAAGAVLARGAQGICGGGRDGPNGGRRLRGGEMLRLYGGGLYPAEDCETF